MKLTQRNVLKEIRSLGLTANVVEREYRVDYRQHDPRYKAGTHGTKYHTDDPGDALGTARIMAKGIAVKGKGKLIDPPIDGETNRLR